MLFSTVKPKRRELPVQTLSEIAFSLRQQQGSSHLRIWQLLLLASIAYPTSLALRWSGSSTQFLLKLCLGLGRQPPLFYKACNRLLLTKVQAEELVANFAKRFLVFAVGHITPQTLQLKEPTGGQSHNGASGGVGVAMDESEVAFATLSYYMVSELPGTLAVVRYHASDDNAQTVAVAEDLFFDTPDDFCRLQDDVEDSLLSGVDVCVMSNHPPETFSEINKYLVDDAEV